MAAAPSSATGAPNDRVKESNCSATASTCRLVNRPGQPASVSKRHSTALLILHGGGQYRLEDAICAEYCFGGPLSFPLVAIIALVEHMRCGRAIRYPCLVSIQLMRYVGRSVPRWRARNGQDCWGSAGCALQCQDQEACMIPLGGRR